MNEIEIRLCKTWDECVQCEELQKRVWEMPDYRDAVPGNLLITAIKNGGLLVGAFDRNEMLGFAFGFLGSDRTTEEHHSIAARLKHTSHMLAVLPNARVRGLGARMKWFQRAEAIKQGLELMTWTYDPLQAVNAYLNLARLGAFARRYYRNAYGEMTDALNAGLASDRFEVEWELTSARVCAREKGETRETKFENARRVYEIEWTPDLFPRVIDEHALSEHTNLIEIPSDINALKAENLALAIAWREKTRATFERAFSSGYAAVDFLRATDENGRARAFYVLRNENISPR